MGLLNNAESQAETNGGVTDVVAKGAADVPDASPSPAVKANATTAPATATPATAPATAEKAPNVTEQATVGTASTDDLASAAEKTQALAPMAGRAVVKTGPKLKSPYESLKGVLQVDYNTLAQIILTNGNLVARETKDVLGDTGVFNLISWQDAFVLSPEDDDAPNEVVKYSDDGVMTTEGQPVEEALAYIRTNGYPKAKLKQRVVLVGAIESMAKSDKFNGTLMQFDLSPASKVQWDRLQANMMYQVGIGAMPVEKITRIKVETKLATKGTNTYTYGEFTIAA